MLPASTAVERVVENLQVQGIIGAGRNFYTTNGTAQHQQRGGSDTTNRGQTPDEPLATADYATGLCTAGRGDNVILGQGHAESVSSAGAITSDVADVSYCGLGRGTSRPTFTFDTSTAATWVMSAANLKYRNIIFDLTGVDELVVGLVLTGSDATFENCRFVVADSGGQCVKAMTLSAAADRTRFVNCEWVGDTANGTSNLECLSIAAVTGFYMEDCYLDIVGAAGVGPIHFTGAATEVRIKRTVMANRVASATACIDCDSLAVVGEHVDCGFILGTIATAGTGIVPVVAASGFLSSIRSGVVNDQNESDAIVGSAST